MNRLLLLLMALALLGTGASWALTPEHTTPPRLLYWGLGVAELAGLVLLLRNGTLAGTNYFYGLLGCWTLALVGGLFKVSHYPGADLLLLVGLLGMALLYTVWFRRKPVKTRLAALKLLTVLAATVGGLGVLLRWLPRETTYLTHGLFWLTVLDFVATDYRRLPDAPAPRS